MSTPVQAEATFRSYSVEEAKFYNSQRTAYPPAIYNVILQHHGSTGGQFGSLLDCGCGPGNATRDLAPLFDQVLGVDAGAGMVTSARELGGKTKSGSDIRYEVSPAEEFSRISGLQAGSVDLLTVATAVHWFDMPKFWAEAAKVLKPGGTVALWTRGSHYCHPSTPNAPKLKEILQRFTGETVAPYELPGNRLSRNMYDDLPLPWDVSPPVTEFPKSKYVKHEYDRDGVLSNGETFFGGGTLTTLEHVEMALATASPVKRWRDANPELAGTENDAVKVLVREFREAMGDQKSVIQGSGIAILLFKKAD